MSVRVSLEGTDRSFVWSTQAFPGVFVCVTVSGGFEKNKKKDAAGTMNRKEQPFRYSTKRR